MLRPGFLLLALLALPSMRSVFAEGLTAESLGVVFNRDNSSSVRVARYYAQVRGIPAANLIGLAVPDRAVIGRAELKVLQRDLSARLPTGVQSLLLVWSRPYAAECMSITTALAVGGYQPAFCEPGCKPTLQSPLYDADGWLPADTVGWLPAMLLPSDDEALARTVIDRGVLADDSKPLGGAYLVRTADASRNVRAALYGKAQETAGRRITVRTLDAPVGGAPADILAYFTGAAWVDELPKLKFRPGAVADHLTSYGGVLGGTTQMTAMDWLRQGATASYGTVSEPCNVLGKFPNPAVFLDHYLRGDTLLVAYWKSVAMPGQGLFVGEPLSRPYPLWR